MTKFNDHKTFSISPLAEILNELAKSEPMDFLANLKVADVSQLSKGGKQVLVIRQILKVAKKINRPLCLYAEKFINSINSKNSKVVGVYNGAYWEKVNHAILDIKSFLGKAAAKMGILEHEAVHFKFINTLYKLLLSNLSILKTPKPSTSQKTIKINFKNGTLHITPDLKGIDGGIKLMPFDSKDSMRYQLDFAFDPKAKCPFFENFLDEKVTSKQDQKKLGEFLGSVLVGRSSSRPKKALLLLNSESTEDPDLFKILKALLSQDNISEFSLKELTAKKDHHRIALPDKLINLSANHPLREHNYDPNYLAEMIAQIKHVYPLQILINGKPLDVKLPYKGWVSVKDYQTRLIFSHHKLPHANYMKNFFKNKEIAKYFICICLSNNLLDEEAETLINKIIDNELPGVFNWILNQRESLLKQKGIGISTATGDKQSRPKKVK